MNNFDLKKFLIENKLTHNSSINENKPDDIIQKTVTIFDIEETDPFGELMNDFEDDAEKLDIIIEKKKDKDPKNYSFYLEGNRKDVNSIIAKYIDDKNPDLFNGMEYDEMLMVDRNKVKTGPKNYSEYKKRFK